MNRLAAALCGLATMLPSAAPAHINLVYPMQRAPLNLVAVARPCGLSPDPGRGPATKFLPGASVELRWTEWITHPGHFRISFDADGTDDFVDPSSYTDFYTAPSVLLDNIAPADNVTQHSATIVLPNIECDTCTLQLMQVLTDKPPFTTDANSDDMHRQCADVTLTPTANDIFENGFEAPPAV
jgi:hypothetical protein